MKVASSIKFKESVQSRGGATRISVIRLVRSIFHNICLVTAVAKASARRLTVFQLERFPRICILKTSISALSGLIKHDVVITLSAIIGSILHLTCKHTIVISSECSWSWLTLTSFINCVTSRGGLISIYGHMLLIFSHPHGSCASSDFFITFYGFAKNARLHLRRNFQTLLWISRISIINAKISRTTKVAHVKILPIENQ